MQRGDRLALRARAQAMLRMDVLFNFERELRPGEPEEPFYLVGFE